MFDWADLGQNLLGTLIGAVLALAGAMWWDGKKDRADTRARRLRTIRAIRKDLEGTNLSFEIPELEVVEGGEFTINMSVPLLLSAAFETAIHSGNLALLPSDTQAALSAFYEQLRIARLSVDVLATIYVQGGNAIDVRAHMENAASSLQGDFRILKKQLPDIIEALDRAEGAG